MIILNTENHLKEDLLILFSYFTCLYLTIFFFITSFQILMRKSVSKNIMSIIYIAYRIHQGFAI